MIIIDIHECSATVSTALTLLRPNRKSTQIGWLSVAGLGGGCIQNVPSAALWESPGSPEPMWLRL